MQNILKKTTEDLLFKPGDYKAIYDAVHTLHDLYAPLTGIAVGNISDQDIYLPQGKAISPTKAAFCLLEGQRTAVFTRGIYKAILQLQKQFPGEKLNILYAGCGPYATLLTPFTTLFGPEEISFSLLDINPISLEAVKKLYAQTPLSEYVSDFICEDATTYKVTQPAHMIISETMLNGLKKEPQVAIMLNLVPQVMPGGIFIPQEISVTAQLLNPFSEMKQNEPPFPKPKRLKLGTVYSIGQQDCREQTPVQLQIPDDIENCYSLELLTDIRTFDNEKLGFNESSLNLPLKVDRDIRGKEGSAIVFTYCMGERPGFMHEWVDVS